MNINLNDLARIGNALDASISSLFIANNKKKLRLVRRDDIVWKPLACKETSDEFNQHEGVELCIVTKGRIETFFDRHESQLVNNTDALFYQSGIPHKWANPDSPFSEFILINLTADL